MIKSNYDKQTFEYAPGGDNGFDRSLVSYLKDVADKNPLSREEEAELGRRIKEGDINARNRLVEANLRFVFSVAKEYRNTGRSFNDLISAGNDGLITAAGRFDYSRGNRFITYAAWWVRQAILQDIAEYGRMVRLPTNWIDMLSKFERFSEEHLKKTGEEPSLGDIANEFNVTVSNVSRLLKERENAYSFDDDEDGDKRPLYEVVSDPNQQQPDDIVARKELEDVVRSSVNKLNRREAEVLRCYFGLDGYSEMTLEELGGRFGLTRERVRQIKEKGLMKLRGLKNGKKLLSYSMEFKVA